MFRKILLFVPALAMFMSLGLQPVYAQYGLDETAKSAGLEATGKDLPQKVGEGINIALSVIGLVFLILAVYGGFKILLSRGQTANIEKGRDTILYATLGLVIIAAAYAITTYVIGAIAP